MKLETATAVINQAKSGGNWDRPMPVEPSDRISMAQEIYDQAVVARDRLNIKADSVLAVIATVESEEQESESISEPSSSAESSSVTSPALDTSDECGHEMATGLSVCPGCNEDLYPPSEHNLATVTEVIIAREQQHALMRKEGLPIPPELEGEPPVLPRDLTQKGDTEVRRLHSEFAAALARANYLVSLETADEYAAKMIYERLYARALARVERTYAEGDKVKSKTVPQLEAEAAQDQEVQEWAERYHTHHVQNTFLKSIRDGYKDYCDRLSRDWTMRTEERDHAAR